MRPIIIANWKMNLSLSERMALATNLTKSLKAIDAVDVVVCPSFTSLESIQAIIVESGIQLGAQNAFWEKSGAYTGEESPTALYEIGCRYVILGHSERRQYLGETNEIVNKKVAQCLESNLIPIVCVGETFEQRQSNQTDAVIYEQISKALAGVSLTPEDQLIIAYEPVWVIGSGQAIDTAEADHVFKVIYQVLTDMLPVSLLKSNVRIVYGGSIDQNNARSFVDIERCDGLLIGGASLKADIFNTIVTTISHAYSS